MSLNTKNCAEGHRALVKHRDARAGERHQLVGHQMNEQVRHRAVQALEGEPGKVARAGADTTQRHLGHALGGKAVAQVAHAADVDVAHRRCLQGRRGSGSAPRLPSWGCVGTAGCPAASETPGGCPPAWPRRWGPRPAPGWPASGSWSPRRSQKVTNAPMSFVKARATVTLCSATPFGTLDCCVCTVGWLNTRDLPERSARLKDSTSAESRTTWEARTRTFWISKSVLSVAPAGCASAFSDHSAVVASANSISITRFSCGGSIFPQRRMPTMVGRSSTSA